MLLAKNEINLSTLAAIRYIREISDKIWLSNGEGLPYVVSNKRRFMKRIVDEKRPSWDTADVSYLMWMK